MSVFRSIPKNVAGVIYWIPSNPNYYHLEPEEEVARP